MGERPPLPSLPSLLDVLPHLVPYLTIASVARLERAHGREMGGDVWEGVLLCHSLHSSAARTKRRALEERDEGARRRAVVRRVREGKRACVECGARTGARPCASSSSSSPVLVCTSCARDARGYRLLCSRAQARERHGATRTALVRFCAPYEAKRGRVRAILYWDHRLSRFFGTEEDEGASSQRPG